jgi:hypothetical protein
MEIYISVLDAILLFPMILSMMNIIMFMKMKVMIGLLCITLLLRVMVKLNLVMKQSVFLLVMPILPDYSMHQKMEVIWLLKIMILAGIEFQKPQHLLPSLMLLPISHNLLINVNKVPNFFTTPLLLFKMELLTETLILTTLLLKSVVPMITEVNNVS